MTDVKHESFSIDIDMLQGISSKSEKLFDYFSAKKQFSQIKEKEKVKIYKLALLAFLDALGYSKRVSRSGHKELFHKVLHRYETTVSGFILQNGTYMKELGNVEVLAGSTAKKLPLEDNSRDELKRFEQLLIQTFNA